MLDCQLFGLNAGGHDFTNVLLHTIAAVLLFLLLQRMTGALWPGAFARRALQLATAQGDSALVKKPEKDLDLYRSILLCATLVQRMRISSELVQRALTTPVGRLLS